MFINAIGYYIPEERVSNDYYTEKTGLSDDWLVQRTGIKTRSRAREDENVNTMSVDAVINTLPSLPYDIKEVDLIISSTYTPYDTVGTAAHFVQQQFGIVDAKAFTLSSACSSFLNAMEIIEGYFALGKARKALIIGGDKNSAYNNESDPKSGHLWGDAAVACFFSNERITEHDYEVLDIHTEALGCLGKGPGGIMLHPREKGIIMQDGIDVFVKACACMPKIALFLLEKRGFTFEDLSYFIAHQANMRILKNIANNIKLSEEKLLSNIEELGNTGCASCALVFAQNKDKFKKGELICLCVFGGGYSAGACLISV